jgi:hypothetical protein
VYHSLLLNTLVGWQCLPIVSTKLDVVAVALVLFFAVDIIYLAPFLVLFLQYWHGIFGYVVVFLIEFLWDQLFDEALMAID